MALTEEAIQPLRVEIFTMYPDAKPPERASGDVAGSLPSRAVQKCPPVTAASGFGWYVYPPVDFALRWDGQHTEFSLLHENEPAQWRSLAGFYDVKLPQLTEHIAGLPERFQPDVDIFGRDGVPFINADPRAPQLLEIFGRDGVPFINADPRAPQLLELITGTVVRTSPGWCVLARGVPNWPVDRGVQILDGIVDCDWYRGTVPTILRLTEPGRVVRFYRRYPLMVLQPVHRSTLAAVSDGGLAVTAGLGNWPEDIWAEFVEMRRKRQDPNHRSSYRQEHARRLREANSRRPAPAEA